MDVMTLMERSTDYILGMSNIKNSDKYIFFEYSDRGLNKNVVIDKKKHWVLKQREICAGKVGRLVYIRIRNME